MLAITQAAATAIETVLSGDQAPEGAGLRIGAETIDGQGATLQLALVSGPLATDQVVERSGARVFVGEEAVPFLDDKLLDARVEDEHIAFEVSAISAG